MIEAEGSAFARTDFGLQRPRADLETKIVLPGGFSLGCRSLL